MLLRTKSNNEPPGHEMTMGLQYHKKARQQRIIGVEFASFQEIIKKLSCMLQVIPLN